MQRELPQDIDMVQFHGEDFEIIRRLLSVNHLFQRYIQLETINLMLDLDFPGADDTERLPEIWLGKKVDLLDS